MFHLRNTQFFRRYDVRLENDPIVTEFDYGFLSPAGKVYHAHNHAAFELIAVSKEMNIIDIPEKTPGYPSPYCSPLILS